MADGPRIRNAVRVLLLDEDDRLLLLRLDQAEAGRSFWHTPGGGVEAGEDGHAAAAREVLEETGLRELQLGAEVWYRRHRFTYRHVDYDQRERWFLARVAHFQPVPTGLTEEEQADLTDWRWWTLEAMQDTEEELVPRDLPVRLRELLRDGPRGDPIDISAHDERDPSAR